jgi:uncharacterized protein (DUF305 family)
MIPHHEGAVVMARELAEKTERPELKSLADDVVKTQTDEIARMREWQLAWQN